MALSARAATNPAPIRMLARPTANTWPLIHDNQACKILTDPHDATVVGLVAEALARDLELVTGFKPTCVSTPGPDDNCLIIAGTIGQSMYIDQLASKGKIDVSLIRGQWETYLMQTVDEPLPGVHKALVVAGSNRRGTAYGLFEISRMAGVSPWVWWADVLPARQPSLFVTPGKRISHEPAVKYRGIFINDEDWGLNPWAAKNLDTDIHDIGPKTYAKIFELLLRLNANFIWPAMHDSTKAFFHYPDNPVVADRYAIVLGSTHCDQMLRSNTFEWQKGFETEYGRKPGDYRYDTNRPEVQRYWGDRVRSVKDYESVFTIGMRGIRDGSIVGPSTRNGKIALLDTILRDQRNMFERYFGTASGTPQLFCPYKEVLDLYQGGLKLPDDVTLVWTDDNYGYLRQLSTPEEQKRSGASGIYYHLSYLGKPHDYIWLSTNSPALISYEMTKAFQFGADRLWVVNVGDLKPGEMETQFFLDMAWNPSEWTPDKAWTYGNTWYATQFGIPLSAEIAALRNRFYELAQSGKPEHLGLIRYDAATMRERLKAYESMVSGTIKTRAKVPSRLQNAYYELVEYPIRAAASMNQKVLYARLSFVEQPLEYSIKAKQAYDSIQALSKQYNEGILNGKWSGMIDPAPRNLAVYGMPPVARPDVLSKAYAPKKYNRAYLDTTVQDVKAVGSISVKARNFSSKSDAVNDNILVFEGLGAGGSSISRYPFNGPSYSKSDYRKAPSVTYHQALPIGDYTLRIKALPTQRMHAGRNLTLGISVNGDEPVFVDLHQARNEKTWMRNVLLGFAEANIPINWTANKMGSIRLYLLDTGLALNSLEWIKK
jgi:hypothetical protein